MQNGIFASSCVKSWQVAAHLRNSDLVPGTRAPLYFLPPRFVSAGPNLGHLTRRAVTMDVMYSFYSRLDLGCATRGCKSHAILNAEPYEQFRLQFCTTCANCYSMPKHNKIKVIDTCGMAI